jgi:hypothetical protein
MVKDIVVVVEGVEKWISKKQIVLTPIFGESCFNNWHRCWFDAMNLL